MIFRIASSQTVALLCCSGMLATVSARLREAIRCCLAKADWSTILIALCPARMSASRPKPNTINRELTIWNESLRLLADFDKSFLPLRSRTRHAAKPHPVPHRSSLNSVIVHGIHHLYLWAMANTLLRQANRDIIHPEEESTPSSFSARWNPKICGAVARLCSQGAVLVTANLHAIAIFAAFVRYATMLSGSPVSGRMLPIRRSDLLQL